jgi:hypothetical protein
MVTFNKGEGCSVKRANDVISLLPGRKKQKGAYNLANMKFNRKTGIIWIRRIKVILKLFQHSAQA